MSSGVEQHSDILLRLMLRNCGSQSDRLRDGCVEVAHLEVEVHHWPLGSIFWRPDRSFVVSCFLEHDVDGPLGRSKDAGARFFVPNWPIKKL